MDKATPKLAGKKAPKAIMDDVERLVKELDTTRPIIKMWTASVRDFLWTITDQQKRITALEELLQKDTPNG